MAVLLVVLYHAGGFGLAGGYIGVDVFFVISGYLITGLLLKEVETKGGLRFVDFYARRARRLVPAATVVLVATTGVAWLLYSPLELKKFTTSAIATAAYLSNFLFAYQSTDYLNGGTDVDPLLHTWSLGVEEQFYLIWPLLIWLIARAGPAASLRLRLFYGFGALAALSFALSLWLTVVNQPWAFFGSPTRAWEFAVGGAVALWRPRTDLSGPIPARFLGLAGLALILGAAVLMNDRTPFPGMAALLPVLGAALVIACGHRAPSPALNRLLGTGPLRFLGDVSYSLYLWHWPVLIFLALALGKRGWPVAAAGLSLSLLLAWLTYTLVENPFRFNAGLVRRAGKSLAAAVVLLAAVVSLVVGVRAATVSTLAQDTFQRYLAASKDVSKIYANGCQADMLTVEPADCVYGSSSAPVTVVIFGDSHAAQWLPAFKLLAEREGWRLVLLTKSACASMAYSQYSIILKRPYVECDRWRERAFEKIAALRPAVTVLSNTMADAEPEEGQAVAGLDAAGWGQATRVTLARLAELSAATVVIRDTPWLNFDAPVCLSRAAWRGRDPDQACVFDPHTEMFDLAFAVESAAVADFPTAYMVDMTPAICPRRPCPVEREGVVLYHDFQHLTVSFVEQLAGPLFERLAPIFARAKGPQQDLGE